MYRYGALSLGLTLALAATLLYFGCPPDVLAAGLIAVNLVTLATYAYDKAIANSSWMRVPEAGGLFAILFPCRLVAHNRKEWR